MLFRAGVVVSIVVVVIVTVFVVGAAGQTTTAPAALAHAEDDWVPVVNYILVFSKLQETQELMKQATDERARLLEEDNKRMHEVHKLIMDRDLFEQGTDKFKEADERVKRATAEH